jgi:hypothetical protein
VVTECRAHPLQSAPMEKQLPDITLLKRWHPHSRKGAFHE